MPLPETPGTLRRREADEVSLVWGAGTVDPDGEVAAFIATFRRLWAAV